MITGEILKESKVEKLFSLAAGLTLVAVERPALHKENHKCQVGQLLSTTQQ